MFIRDWSLIRVAFVSALGILLLVSMRNSALPQNEETLDSIKEFVRKDYQRLKNELESEMEELRKFKITGSVKAYMGQSDPDGWLICDGRVIDKQKNSKYSDLVDFLRDPVKIGSSIYQVDGNPAKAVLPDLRGRFLRGAVSNKDDSAARDLDRADRESEDGKKLGPCIGSIQGFATHIPKIPFETDLKGKHSHQVYTTKRKGDRTGNGISLVYGDWGLCSDEGNEIPIGFFEDHLHHIVKGGDHETRPVNVYVNWIIKY
ncbi:tail fiber protein [Candidatus Sumerlaeota bacterium]|nr:tail fiber protein [Candidatus Sumerlaeota bacterium]